MPDTPDPDKVTRNWNELIQELRALETGVQVLTGFLLTVPFSSRFDRLTDTQLTIYLCVLVGSVLTTALVVAPVAFHRLVFRHHERLWLVEAANRCARAGLTVLALTSSGVLLLVFDLALGTTAGVVALVVALVFFAVLWVAVPLTSSRHAAREMLRDDRD